MPIDISELKNKSTETGSDQTFTGEPAQMIKTDAGGLVDPSLLPAVALAGGETTPTAGTVIVPSAVTDKTATATWGVASDVGGTQQTSLKYRAVLSTAPVVDINDAVNLDAWQNRWSRNLTSIDLYGLTHDKTYFVTVFVKNWDENIAIYTSVSFTTAAADARTYYVDPVNAAGGGFATGEPEAVAGLTLGVDVFVTLTDALTKSESETNAAGTTILLSNGTHDVSGANDSIALFYPTHIIGLGKNRTTLLNGGGISLKTPIHDQFIGNRNSMIFFDALVGAAVPNVGTVASLTIDGNTALPDIRYGLQAVATDIVVANCFIRDINSGDYNGQGFASTVDPFNSPSGLGFANTVLAQNNTFRSNNRADIQVYDVAPNAMIRWNTAYALGSLDGVAAPGGAQDPLRIDLAVDQSHRSAGFGDITSNGIVVGSCENAQIIENEVNDYQGIALTDGSRSSGILLFNWGDFFFGEINNPNSSGTVLYNDINRCTFALFGGVQTTNQPCQITFRGNVIRECENPFQRGESGLFDVTDNYWGGIDPEKAIHGNQILGDNDIQIYPVAKSDKIETF